MSHSGPACDVLSKLRVATSTKWKISRWRAHSGTNSGNIFFFPPGIFQGFCSPMTLSALEISLKIFFKNPHSFAKVR